jgi:hypothetical protein
MKKKESAKLKNQNARLYIQSAKFKMQKVNANLKRNRIIFNKVKDNPEKKRDAMNAQCEERLTAE